MTIIKVTSRAGKEDAAAGKGTNMEELVCFLQGCRERELENTGGGEEQNSASATGELCEPVPSGGGEQREGDGEGERERSRDAGRN